MPPTSSEQHKNIIVHDFDFNDGFSWFAFSDATFAINRVEPGRVVFTDADGQWEVQHSPDPTAPDLDKKRTMFPHRGQKHLVIRRLDAGNP